MPLLLATVLVLGASDEHGRHGGPPTPGGSRFEPPAPGSYELPAIGRVADAQLLGASGAPAPLLGLGPGEAALVSFVYLSCHDACPAATATFAALDAALASRPELARRVELVTVSFDPARDTPEKMAALERSLAPHGRWRFLTARSPDAIAPVLEAFGQDATPIDETQFVRHVLKVFLIDADHRIRNIYSTGFLDPRLVLADLETVLAP